MFQVSNDIEGCTMLCTLVAGKAIIRDGMHLKIQILQICLLKSEIALLWKPQQLFITLDPVLGKGSKA